MPWVLVDGLDLTSSGWSGAPSIGDLVEQAVHAIPGGEKLDGNFSKKCIVVIDELHHMRMLTESSGSIADKRAECLSSLLGIAGGGMLTLEDGSQWSSEQALVIGMGAFTDLIDLTKPVGILDVVRAGIPLELCTRFGEEIIVLQPLPERDLVQLLRRWPALVSLEAVCARLGFSVRIHAEAYQRAARVVTLGYSASTARTAGGWLVSAVRQELMRALSSPDTREIVIAPDSLPIPINATRPPPPDEPPIGPGGWDATIVLSPR